MDIKLSKMRKSLAIRNRIIYPSAIYHLIQRAPGSERLFLENKDYLYMLSLMKEIVNEFKWKIFSFTLMPNHIHSLIQIIEENLSQGAKFLFQRYAIYFNKKYERKGPVFCRPFRAFLCLDDSYLISASIYIHLNAYKSGLVKDPLKYKWSSINLYTEDKDFNSFVDYRFILSILHHDIKRARQIYYNLLKEAGNLEYRDILKEPDFIHEFCSEIAKFRRFYSKTKDKKDKKEWELEKEIEKFKKMRYLKKSSKKEKKKKLIEKLIVYGYRKSEIAQLLKLSRQQVYRLLFK